MVGYVDKETLRTFVVTYLDEEAREQDTIERADGFLVTANGDLMFLDGCDYIAAYARGNWASVGEFKEDDDDAGE